jgi:hypothetical protein
MTDTTDDCKDYEPTIVELREGETADLDLHTRRNLQQIRQGNRALREENEP